MQPNANMPAFLYIGGPRCGSTWLSAVLSEHPEIFIPPTKEIHFFNDRMPYSFEYRYPRGIEFYKSFFDGVKPDQVAGDLSPFYFIDPNAAWRIKQALPDVKLMCFLREPVSLLYSLYLLLRQREKREPSFDLELQKNPQLIDLCRFSTMLQPYIDLFGKERIFFRLYEDLYTDVHQTIRDVFTFLEVDPHFVPPSLEVRFNKATTAKPGLVSQQRGTIISFLNKPYMIGVKRLLISAGVKDIRHYNASSDHGFELKHEGLQDETREMLESMLAPEMKRLLDMFPEVDFSSWRKKQASDFIPERKQAASIKNEAEVPTIA